MDELLTRISVIQKKYDENTNKRNYIKIGVFGGAIAAFIFGLFFANMAILGWVALFFGAVICYMQDMKYARANKNLELALYELRLQEARKDAEKAGVADSTVFEQMVEKPEPEAEKPIIYYLVMVIISVLLFMISK